MNYMLHGCKEIYENVKIINKNYTVNKIQNYCSLTFLLWYTHYSGTVYCTSLQENINIDGQQCRCVLCTIVLCLLVISKCTL